MVATADLWVYNAEHLCVSFFYQVASIRHLGGGKIKKSFFGLLNGKHSICKYQCNSFRSIRQVKKSIAAKEVNGSNFLKTKSPYFTQNLAQISCLLQPLVGDDDIAAFSHFS